jgi:hypothetical protein
MIKHFTRTQLINQIRSITSGGPYVCPYRGDGRAGNLLESLLGITGNNHDVADAVGFELKTSLSASTPITLFHKDPKPRNKKNAPGALQTLIHNYGWDSTHHDAPVKSFRATIYGSWSSSTSGKKLFVTADETQVAVTDGQHVLAYWDTNDLVAGAAAKLRNMMYVDAIARQDGTISFVNAHLYEQFQPFKFVKAIESGNVAIDFRTNHGKSSLRNHGTKFRIKTKDALMIYGKVTQLSEL